MTIYNAYIYKIVLWTTFLTMYQTFICFLVIIRLYIKEYTQWNPFFSLEINLIQLNMRQMKVKSGKIEVKNSLVWV